MKHDTRGTNKCCSPSRKGGWLQGTFAPTNAFAVSRLPGNAIDAQGCKSLALFMKGFNQIKILE